MTFKRLKLFFGKLKTDIILFRHYAGYFTLKKPKTKQIVVCFDGLFPHGGLVDRLKGIISMYQIAKELNYDFKILFDNPFKLNSFLEPNQVNWSFNRKQIQWHPSKTRVLYLINNFQAQPIQLIQKSSANHFYVYANIDYSKSTFPELNPLQLEKNWRDSFNVLFKQSKLLSEKLNHIETEPFIAFHSRFTSLMGDFKDTSTKILTDKERVELCGKLLQLINNTIIKEEQKAYLFSDSINFIEYVKDKITIKTVEGNPFHMDNFEKTNDTNGHLKTLIDFFMISKSKKVYFLKVNPMYNSSFSKYASIVGNTKFERLEA